MITKALAFTALFLSLTAGAIAAGHVLITRITQIAPAVRTELRGERGPAGPPGPAGRPGLSGTLFDNLSPYTQAGPEVSLAQGNATSSASCPEPGSRLLSGGFDSQGAIIHSSAPVDQGAIWEVSASLAPGASSGFVIAWALCANAGGDS